MHEQGPYGDTPVPGPVAPPAARVDGSSRRHPSRASLKLSQTLAGGRHSLILTVLKRSVVLWVKEAMK